LITVLRPGDLPDGSWLEVVGRVARKLEFYAQAEPGEVFALVGSTGRIEISVNRGSAKDVLRASVGDEVRVVKSPDPPLK
jgi:S-adenosylmethionine hydrolase